MSERSAQIAALRRPLGDLPDPLPIPVIERPFDVTIRPPGSKSITNRALLLAALAEGTSELRGPLIDADDAQVMLAAIQQLGATVSTLSESEGRAVPMLKVTGVGGRWKIPAGSIITLNLNNAGTATRFLTAAAMLAPPSTSIIIDGDARMRERPIDELAEAVYWISGMEWLGREGFPPLRVLAREPSNIDRHTLRCWDFEDTSSSQFISALLMVAPFFEETFPISMPAAPTSEPYIRMTLDLLAKIGLHFRIERDDQRTTVSIPPQSVSAFTIDIEPDASGATYFEAAAALIPGARCTIDGLDLHPSRPSLQGDTHFISAITGAGARVERLNKALGITGGENIHPLNLDLADMPDTAMTAAILACFAAPTPDNPTSTTTLRGLRTLRVKETDRLAALQTELTKLGAEVLIIRDGDDEGLRITPPAHTLAGKPLVPSAHDAPLYFDTYNDHRMAMSLALVGLRVPHVFIRNPRCVAKTYPTFWRDLARLYE